MRIAPVAEPTLLTRTDLVQENTEAATPTPTHGVGELSFGDIFAQVVQQANVADSVATQKVDALAHGVNDDIHGTMIATKEADISVKLVGTIRNKLLDAFNELWKTSV